MLLQDQNESVELTQVRSWLDAAGDFLIAWGPRVLGALLTLFVGWLVARLLARTVRRLLDRGRVDPMLTSFLGNLTYVALMTFVVVSAAGQIGVQTASFIAVIGAAGVAIGFAMQGSLSNLAAGVMLLVFRPFRAGDVVEAGGTLGTVDEVGIFATTFRTPDNKRVIVSNSKVTGDNITNFSAFPTRRVDLVFAIAHDDDLLKAKEVVRKVLDSDPRVLKDPAPEIAVGQLGESSVNLVCRPWVATKDYWAVTFDLLERVKLALGEAGMRIPYPQRDVHLHSVA
jgi:small conductance mechanosensitive channel